jgi:hypothetical protein
MARHAEYLALNQLQADTFVTLDARLVRSMSGIVRTGLGRRASVIGRNRTHGIDCFSRVHRRVVRRLTAVDDVLDPALQAAAEPPLADGDCTNHDDIT